MANDQVPALVDESKVKEPGQKAVTVPFLMRNLLPWTTPPLLPSESWRYLVRNQPIAMICRQTILDTIVSMPWRITSRSPTNDYTKEVDKYTDLFESGDGGYDIHTELVLSDMLDIPFGGISELGRQDDDPEGEVLWFQRIDGGTMVPTGIIDPPVAQVGYTPVPIYFPEYTVDRLYYSPRPEITRRGWGMAPPERIYLGFEQLARGDRWYANLLLDTPEAGLLDLGDMSGESASKWLESWRTLVFGTDALKVPVLYEHTTAAKFIPFGRSPLELAYPAATLRYMQVVSAGYGLTLADTGIVEGDAGSLGGAIRGERRTMRTGIGTARRKITAYRCRMLPKHLKFEIVERDDEALVAKGRALLANSMALRNLSDGGLIEKKDALEELKSEGLISLTATLPEPVEPKAQVVDVQTGPHVVAGELQKPVAPSAGGASEVKVPPGKAKSAVVERAETLATEFNKELQLAVVEAGGKPFEGDPSVEITNEAILETLSLFNPEAEFEDELIDLIVSKAAPVVGQLPISLWKGD